MQGTTLTQHQHQRAIPIQIQSNSILNMNILELQEFLETESIENPALCLEESSRCPVCGFLTTTAVCPVCNASLKKIEDNQIEFSSEYEYLERAFAAVRDNSSFDPFRTVATSLDIREYLKQQASMTLGGRELRIAFYIIDSLDDDGYFRE